MWERIKLSNNYTKALEQVLAFPPIPLIPIIKPCNTDRQGTHILAQFRHPQMQAARNQNHTISHQDATVEATTTVTPHSTSSILGLIGTSAGQSSSESRKNLTGEKPFGSAKLSPQRTSSDRSKKSSSSGSSPKHTAMHHSTSTKPYGRQSSTGRRAVQTRTRKALTSKMRRQTKRTKRSSRQRWKTSGVRESL